MPRLLLWVTLGTLFATLPLVCRAATVPGITAQNVVNPGALPATQFAHFYAASELHKLKSAFALYVSIVKSKNRLNSSDLPPRFATTITGQTVDLRALFIFANSVQRALTLEGKPTLKNPASAYSVNVSSHDLPIAHPLNVRLGAPATPPPPPAPPPPPPSPSPPSPSVATPAPVVAPTCNPAALPTVSNVQDAWAEVEALASGKKPDGSSVSRCGVSIAPALDQSETQPAVSSFIPPTVSVPAPPFNGPYVSEAFANNVTFSEASGTSTLALDSDLNAQLFGEQFHVLKLDAQFVSAAAAGAAGDTTTAGVSITIGSSPVFDITNSINPNYSYALPGSQRIVLIPPFRAEFANTHFEVDCSGTIALNGKVFSDRYGGYVTASPTIDVQVNGGVSASYLFVSGTLSGTINLVTASGQIGALVAMFPDTTAPGFSTEFKDPPLLVATRTFGSVKYTILEGSSLKAVLKVLGFPVVHVSIPIANAGHSGELSLPSQWQVARII
jgi:hypothetical protein